MVPPEPTSARAFTWSTALRSARPRESAWARLALRRAIHVDVGKVREDLQSVVQMATRDNRPRVYTGRRKETPQEQYPQDGVHSRIGCIQPKAPLRLSTPLKPERRGQPHHSLMAWSWVRMGVASTCAPDKSVRAQKGLNSNTLSSLIQQRAYVAL